MQEVLREVVMYSRSWCKDACHMTSYLRLTFSVRDSIENILTTSSPRLTYPYSQSTAEEIRFETNKTPGTTVDHHIVPALQLHKPPITMNPQNNPVDPTGAKATGAGSSSATKPKAFDEHGAIGHQFTGTSLSRKRQNTTQSRLSRTSN